MVWAFNAQAIAPAARMDVIILLIIIFLIFCKYSIYAYSKTCKVSKYL